jgi:hypothetical protein
MRNPLLLFLLLTPFLNCYSQNDESTDKQKITMVVNQFFEALEKKDTTLLQSIALSKGQKWRIYDDDRPEKVNMRFVQDDIQTLHSLPAVKETALGFDIKIHHNIAVAWVPYEFRVEDEFSHCGVDIFTLFRIDGSWKIISTAYSVEKKHCEELRHKKK